MTNKIIKRILLIGYGGTIVMVVKGNKVQPADNVEEIISMVPKIKDHADIDLKILSNVDSTNVMPSDWENMTKCLIENRDNYDGFVVAHGTNTMSYSASAVALALGKGFGKPVVFTGSQLPLTVWGNDGAFNLENSVKVVLAASEKNINEVMVVFNDVVLRGARTVKVSESDFRAFDSPNYLPLGQIKSTGIKFNDLVVNKFSNDNFEAKNKFRTGIVTVDLTPGQNPFIIKSVLNNRSCEGVILKSHGAGSVPTIGEFSFIPLIEEATKQLGLPVVVATKFLGGNSYKETNDEPAILALEAGAIPSGDMTDVMVEVKLMWLLGQGIRDPAEIKKLMLTDFVGEVSGIDIE